MEWLSAYSAREEDEAMLKKINPRAAGFVIFLFGLSAHAAGQDRLTGNGPLSSMVGGHETGADLIWGLPAGASMGVSGLATLTYRLAEPFTLERAAMIDSVVVYGYQQGAIEGPTIDFLGVELWSGRPGDPGSTRILGDVALDALTDVEHAGAYVANAGVRFTTDRPVYALSAGGLDWDVPAGSYWLVWTMNGTLDGGPYSPYLGDEAEPRLGEAMQRVLGAWRPARNRTEGGVQVSLPFDIYGVAPCPADLDGDGVLTVFDYLAFFNAFASGDLAADCDGDGTLTLSDFQCYQRAFLEGCD